MERTMGKSYISQGERIERLNAVRHEIAQHFNEGFAWIDQILSEEIEQIGLEENLGKWLDGYDDEYWGKGQEFVADIVSKKEVLLALIEKGQNSKRYNWGDTWELNASEIREVLDSLPSIQPATKSRAGRWIDVYDEHIGIDYQCSCCGKKVYSAKQYDVTGKGYVYEFCPRCGAEMESGIE